MQRTRPLELTPNPFEQFVQRLQTQHGDFTNALFTRALVQEALDLCSRQSYNQTRVSASRARDKMGGMDEEEEEGMNVPLVGGDPTSAFISGRVGEAFESVELEREWLMLGLREGPRTSGRDP